MKRILTFMATAILCCSCILDDGHDSHHNSQSLRMYSKSMIERHIIHPLGYVDMMLKLDDYLNASEEERLQDKHAPYIITVQSIPEDGHSVIRKENGRPVKYLSSLHPDHHGMYPRLTCRRQTWT